ncbi:hypothetical protein C4D60_Mb02t08760 [Musa balbisiana]|uniref:Transmembrane protein n=1 Tax=Musa balbisiana TaxID=52838 RepID=A0A4S8IA60_MUSBA|nr:hypothetical protein C4D60_Mb02t08760 [Musa balbisiana]
MVIMDKNCLGEGDPVFDLESGVNSVNKEQQEAKDTVFSVGQDKGVLGRVWNGFVAISGSIKEEALVDKRLGQEAKVGLSEKKIGVEKTKKKGCKKPPKPPRPPNSPPLDAADQKLMKEIAEVAMMKRARIERMKKKMKNAKLTHSNGNFWAFIITILFVIVIIWQAMYPVEMTDHKKPSGKDLEALKNKNLPTPDFHNVLGGMIVE